MNTPKDVHYHSFEVQEIVEKVPTWTYRWGMSVLFVTLAALLIVCSVIRLPIHKKFGVNLTIDQPLLYLVDQPGYKLLFNSKQAVHKGKLITGTPIVAPYSGMLSKLSPSNVSGKDFTYVLIPNQISYHFQGKIPLRYLDAIHKGTQMKLMIASNKLKNEFIVFGTLKSKSPVAEDNEISFYGDIEPKSNQVLKDNILYSPTLKAIAEIPVANATILNSLFGKSN